MPPPDRDRDGSVLGRDGIGDGLRRTETMPVHCVMCWNSLMTGMSKCCM